MSAARTARLPDTHAFMTRTQTTSSVPPHPRSCPPTESYRCRFPPSWQLHLRRLSPRHRVGDNESARRVCAWLFVALSAGSWPAAGDLGSDGGSAVALCTTPSPPAQPCLCSLCRERNRYLYAFVFAPSLLFPEKGPTVQAQHQIPVLEAAPAHHVYSCWPPVSLCSTECSAL